jgi:hypothetical protein
MAALDLAATRLAEDTFDLEPSGRLPLRAPRDARRLAAAFTATPQPLIDSWRTARWVEHRTRPGDTVVLPASWGAAGITVLEQLARPERERRRTVVVADDGALLRALQLAANAEAFDGDAERAAQVDWELVAYRFADDVVATAPWSVDRLASLGVPAGLLSLPGSPVGGPASWPPMTAAGAVFAPEPVSRRSRSPEVLRAVAAARAEGAQLRLVVGPQDELDGFWTGTTWEALSGVRAVLADAVTRGSDCPPGALVVLGDPLGIPSPTAASAVAAGAAVAVTRGSAAHARWPTAAAWTDERELTALLLGRTPAPATASPPAPGAPPAAPAAIRPSAPGRARRVSVGIPVFRDVRFLDDAVSSVLAQTQPPHEILLVDDGSRSAAVDAALAGWRDRDGRVRILRQPNRGVCAARNHLLEEFTGDAFVLLDQDDQVAPTFVEECATILRGRAELQAVATWTEFFGAYEGVEAKPPFDARVGRRENPIVSTCVLVDMQVREAGVRFAEDLAWIFCEDWDLWSQIVATGGAFGLVPRPLARHRVHPDSGGHRRTPLAAAAGRARATAHLRRL